MVRAVAEIEREIRQLSDGDREKLLRSLIAQLDAPSDGDVEHAWLVESHRRLDEIEQGKAHVAPGPQVMEDAHKLVKSIRDQSLYSGTARNAAFWHTHQRTTQKLFGER